jgi:hypothetical protein
MRVDHLAFMLICSAVFLQVVHAADTQLGVAHIGGGYAFTHRDALNEGAAAIESLGARCIKVGLSLDSEKPSSTLYPGHSRWPVFESLADLAATPYFRELFERDFETFILVVFRPGRPAGYWRDGITEADEREEEKQLADLTRYLLTTYAQSHKTFVIQNWEGDWAIRGAFNPATSPTENAISSMIRWLAARQRGVERGRREAGVEGSTVLHGCEVNLVTPAVRSVVPVVTTHVLPHVGVDLVSYSAWDTKDDLVAFEEALGFIASKHRAASSRGCGVYVGEFGYPETGSTPDVVLQRTAERLDVARTFGCPYAVYWQLYCNEPIVTGARNNADFRGFWLIRPDGTRSRVCELFDGERTLRGDD